MQLAYSTAPADWVEYSLEDLPRPMEIDGKGESGNPELSVELILHTHTHTHTHTHNFIYG